MKKIKAIVLAVMLVVLTVVDSVLGLTNITVEASNLLQISVDTVEAKQGDKGVQVAVNIENPSKINIGALVFEITWDSTALKATKVVEGEFKLSQPIINTEKISEGCIRYLDATSIGKITGGQVVIITFDVLNEAKINLNPINIKVLIAATADFGTPEITNITEVAGGINVACVHTNVKDSDYKVTKAPTVAEEGLEEAVCPDCGTKLTRVVDKLVCTHTNVKDSDYKVTKAPTVTEEGLEEAVCPDCGTKLTHLIEKIKYGDINADGSINVQDGIILKKHLAGIKELKINLAASDVNTDGDINIQDAIILLKHLAGMSVTLGK